MELKIRDWNDVKFRGYDPVNKEMVYQGTKEYDTKDKFNHLKFWDWCRDLSKQGHKVFVSEYNAPTDFKCIWEKNVNVSIRPTKTLSQVERLFLYCP